LKCDTQNNPLYTNNYPNYWFFYTPEPPGTISSDGRQAIANLAYFLFAIPWWDKILSILIGVIWISSGNEKKENAE
jgi:hypothetical protein